MVCAHVLFTVYLMAMIFAVLCCLLVISLFKMASKHSTEVLCSVPECRKAMLCLTEKRHVLD